MTLPDLPFYVLNRSDGLDTVHRNPREECNTDDVVDRETIDEATAEALVSRDLARWCAHCHPVEEEAP